MPIGGRWGTVTEASTHLGITRQRILQLIYSGKMGKCKLVEMPGGKVWLIPFPFERSYGQVGRPKKHEGDLIGSD